MICRKCGELLDENAKICPVCGAGQIFDSTTKLNPTHTYAEDCAHEEEHQPRKRRTRVRFRFSPVLFLPLLFFASHFVSPRLGLDGNKVITIVIEVVFGLTAVFYIINARNARRK